MEQFRFKNEEELRGQIQDTSETLETAIGQESSSLEILNLTIQEIKSKYPERYQIYLKLLRVQKLLKNSVLPERLADYEKVIIEYIKKNGSISKSEYEKITDRAHSTQILDFKRLVDKKVIDRQGKGKNTYYVLI